MKLKELQDLVASLDKQNYKYVPIASDQGERVQVIREAKFELEGTAGDCAILSFSEMEEQERDWFVKHGKVPREVILRKLRKCGVGKIYCDFKTEKIPCLQLVDEYLAKIITHDERGFLIMGSIGTGKTTALAYTAYSLLRHRPYYGNTDLSQVRFVSLNRIYRAICERDNELLESLRTVHALLIDDLGAPYDSQYTANMFESLVCERYDDLLLTFFSTNLNSEALNKHHYWQRMIDRIRDPKWMQTPLQFVGSSMRKSDA